jgi:hypothetical protein
MKFKVGDRVRYSINRKGIITRISPGLKYPIYVKWDRVGLTNEYCYCEKELELISPIIDVDDLFAEIEI